MSLPSPTERYAGRERPVFFVAETRQELLQHFDEQCRPLFGSDVRFDHEGNILYPIWRDLLRERVLTTGGYVQLSELDPQADLAAPYTRFTHFEEIRIHQIRTDEGSVETAIRAMDHVIEREQDREMQHAGVVRSRSRELLDLFSRRFTEMTDEEFKTAQRETYAQLTKVGLNPATVVDEHKQRMTDWLIEGSLGEDSLGRMNRLISIQALSAAYRQVLKREGAIGEILVKFAGMREALLFEREFDRQILEEVAGSLEEYRMPAHTLFKNPDRPASNLGIVKGMLNHMRWQLKQPRVKPYLAVGREAGEKLGEVVELLDKGARREIVVLGLFPQAHDLLIRGLENHKDIYPPSTSTP